MKKKILSALLATLMLATMLSGCGGKKDDSTSSNGGNGSGTVSSRVWKFSHTRAEGTDNDIMANKFADSLMENLDGLQIDMYPNNQLGDYTVVQEAVGLDEVQLMLGSMSNGVDPTLSVQIAPYLVNNWDDAYEFYNSDDGIITNYVRESLEKQNIHLLDGLRYLYGEPLSVYATCSRGIVKPGQEGVSPEYDTDDHSTAVLRFENNVTATLVSGCYSQGVRPNCGLVITLNDMVIDYRLRNNLILRSAHQTLDIDRQVDQTLLLDQAFVRAVQTGDPSGIRSPYADALKSLKLCFAANRSMETGEVVYF